VKTKLTLAAWSSVNLNVVPTDSLVELIRAWAFPSRHRRAVWVRLVRLGAVATGCGVVVVVVVFAGGSAVVVNVSSAPSLVLSALLATTR
jgi:hypothetical protein